IRFVDQNHRCEAKGFTNDVRRIIVVVQDALHQREIKTVVREWQLVRIAHGEANRALLLLLAGNLNGGGRRIHARERTKLRPVPKTNRVVAVSTAHIHYRTARKLPGLQNRVERPLRGHAETATDRKSTRLNSSHTVISYAVFCLKKKKKI